MADAAVQGEAAPTPAPPKPEPTEYEQKTEQLREKIAKSDSVSLWDTFRLAGRSIGTDDKRVLSQPEGGTIVGKGLGQAAGQTVAGVGNFAAQMLGDSATTDFLSGLGYGIKEDNTNAADATRWQRMATSLVAGAAGIGVDATVGAVTGTGLAGFAASAAMRAAGNQRQESLQQYLEAGLERGEAESKAEREAIAAGSAALVLDYLGAKLVRNLPGVNRLITTEIVNGTIAKYGAAAVFEGGQEVAESVLFDIYTVVERSDDERLKHLLPQFKSEQYLMNLAETFAVGGVLGGGMRGAFDVLSRVESDSRRAVEDALTEAGTTPEAFQEATGISIRTKDGRKQALKMAREESVPPAPLVEPDTAGTEPVAPEQGQVGMVPQDVREVIRDGKPYSRTKSAQVFRKLFTSGGAIPADVNLGRRMNRNEGAALEAAQLRSVDKLNDALKAAGNAPEMRLAANNSLNGTASADQLNLMLQQPAELRTAL
jgi:hypothetical protein